MNTAAPVPPAHLTNNIMPANPGIPVDSGALASASAVSRIIGLAMGSSFLLILVLYAITF